MSKKIEKNLSERIFKAQNHLAEIISSHKEEVGDYELNASTSIRLKGGTAVVLSYSKSNKINISKEGITIEAKNIKLDGNVEITGELNGKKLIKNGSIEANP